MLIIITLILIAVFIILRLIKKFISDDNDTVYLFSILVAVIISFFIVIDTSTFVCIQTELAYNKNRLNLYEKELSKIEDSIRAKIETLDFQKDIKVNANEDFERLLVSVANVPNIEASGILTKEIEIYYNNKTMILEIKDKILENEIGLDTLFLIPRNSN